jgi:hypothetical protein
MALFSATAHENVRGRAEAGVGPDARQGASAGRKRQRNQIGSVAFARDLDNFQEIMSL